MTIYDVINNFVTFVQSVSIDAFALYMYIGFFI